MKKSNVTNLEHLEAELEIKKIFYSWNYIRTNEKIETLTNDMKFIQSWNTLGLTLK